MNRTKIEWAKNPDGTSGYTWNPITGCLNHDNGLCKGGGFPCYAYKLANTRLKERYLLNHKIAGGLLEQATRAIRNDPFYPRFWEERLEEPYGKWQTDYRPHRHKAKGIFVCDMADLFGIGIPQGWTDKVISIMNSCRNDRFYLLTKQPQNLIKWSPFPENCFVGATCTSKRMINHTLPYLMKVGAHLIYLSIEPLLEWDDHSAEIIGDRLLDAGIGWLIIGQQTPVSAKTEPKIEWIREIVEAADKAGIPVFLKDNLEPLLGQDPHSKRFKGYDAERNMLVGLRQEMPK